MTVKASYNDYLDFFCKDVYSEFKVSKLRPYPNLLLTQHVGKRVKQYYFETCAFPFLLVCTNFGINGIQLKPNSLN